MWMPVISLFVWANFSEWAVCHLLGITLRVSEAQVARNEEFMLSGLFLFRYI